MIRSLLPFILPVMLIMVGVGGLQRLFWPHRHYKCLKVQELNKAGQTAQAGELEKTEARALIQPVDQPRLQSIRAMGMLRLCLGLSGAWLTGLSLAWTGFHTPSWNDGQVPALASLLEMKGRTMAGRSGCLGLAIVAIQGTNQTMVTLGRTAFHGPPVSSSTVFEIGSITKTFTGVALAQAVEQGVVRLDTPVQDLLPKDCLLPEPARDITLQHLTTHTSGFPRLPGNMPILRSILAASFGRNPYAGYSETRFLEAVRHVQLQSEPGQQSQYSNFATALLGHLLSQARGTTWSSLVQEGILDPLHMNDTGASLRPDQQSRFAQGYRALLKLGPLSLGLKAKPWNLTNHWAGAGALRSTPTDMLRYLAANMHPEHQPIHKALTQSHQILQQSSERRAFGMNWIWGKPDDYHQPILWHNGGTGGFHSFLGFTEDRQAGVVILSIGPGSADELGFDILQTLAPPPPKG